MTTVYVTHPLYKNHNLHGHPEHAGRIETIWRVLQEGQLDVRMAQTVPEIVPEALMLKVHTAEMLNILDWTSQQDRITLIDADTYTLPSSYEIAKLSAGGVVKAVEEVLSGRANNALAAVRPPGHHTTSAQSMGFCLLNNVAIATRYAQSAHNINRIMIVDYDVHHGNGTQDIFYEDPSVLFVSSHQYPFYPGTGAVNEIGKGEGKGSTVNVPFGPGHGDANFRRVYSEVLWPVARRFKPELIIVSAGFDAHWHDPLAQMRLSLPGYVHLTRELIAMANELCGGKIVFALEGGYDLIALSHGMRNVAHALLGEDEISDPYGPAPESEPDAGALIDRLKQTHGL